MNTLLRKGSTRRCYREGPGFVYVSRCEARRVAAPRLAKREQNRALNALLWARRARNAIMPGWTDHQRRGSDERQLAEDHPRPGSQPDRLRENPLRPAAVRPRQHAGGAAPPPR